MNRWKQSNTCHTDPHCTANISDSEDLSSNPFLNKWNWNFGSVTGVARAASHGMAAQRAAWQRQYFKVLQCSIQNWRTMTLNCRPC